VVSQKFMTFVSRCVSGHRRPKHRSFDSAEVRFAQDDRPFFDKNFGDKTLEAICRRFAGETRGME